MDLDNSRNLKDNFGRNVRDRALCEVARVLRASIRPYDICAYYGNDEFIVVLSDCSADEAECKRQQIQQSVHEVYFEAHPGKRLQLGISIGASMFLQDGASYEELLALADSRLYQDKASRKRLGRSS
jgi:diguanylate cyclase (GGDEF)-like protein